MLVINNDQSTHHRQCPLCLFQWRLRCSMFLQQLGILLAQRRQFLIRWLYVLQCLHHMLCKTTNNNIQQLCNNFTLNDLFILLSLFVGCDVRTLQFVYITTLWGKNCTVLFLPQVCQTKLYFNNFWHTYTLINLPQNSIKLSSISWRMSI